MTRRRAIRLRAASEQDHAPPCHRPKGNGNPRKTLLRQDVQRRSGRPRVARVPPFHHIQEARKPPEQRVYHDNDACSLGRLIQPWERREGTAGMRQCKECYRLGLAASRRSWI